MATTALAAGTCVSCVFGAINSATLSFTNHVLETITVSVIPHVTVYENGTAPSTTTSYESITITHDIVYPTGTAVSRPATYTNEADITWTVGDATLTYPTTYLQYLAFAGAPMTSDDGQECAQQTDATTISLPDSISTASLIFPISNATAAMQLPSQLLEYLGQLAPISSQLSGDVLTDCATLTNPAVVTAHGTVAGTTSTLPSFVLDAPSATAAANRRRYEGPRRSGPQEPIVTSAQDYGNDTLHRRQDASGTAAPSGTAPTYSYETVPSPSEEASTTTEVSVGGSQSAAQVITSFQTATHTTAYVISAVTGPAIVTTLGAPQAPIVVPPPYEATVSSSVSRAENNPAPQTTSSNSLNSSPVPANPTKAPDQPSAVPDSLPASPAVSGLLGGIGSIATHSAAATTPATSPEVSGLLGGIGSIAAGQTQAAGYTAPAPAQSPGQEQNSPQPQPNGSPQNAPGASPGSEQNQPSPQNTASPQTHAAPVFSIGTAGNAIISTSQDGQYYYGTQALTPGSTITVGSGPAATPVVLQTNGGLTQLVVGASTYNGMAGSAPTPAPGSATPVAVITTQGQTFTAIQGSNSAIILQGASSTITVPAGSVGMLGSQTISADSPGAVVINGNTVPLSAPISTAQAVVNLSNGAFTAYQTGNSIIVQDASSTVTVQNGQVVTYEGHTISAMPSGTAIVVDSTSTSSLTTGAAATTGPVEAIVTESNGAFTVVQTGSSIILQDASSTATLKEGSTIVFEGHTISALSSGSAIAVDATSTIRLTTASASSSSIGVGGYINSGLGPVTPTASSSSTGAAASPSKTANAASRGGSMCLIALSCVCSVLAGMMIM